MTFTFPLRFYRMSPALLLTGGWARNTHTKTRGSVDASVTITWT